MRKIYSLFISGLFISSTGFGQNLSNKRHTDYRNYTSFPGPGYERDESHRKKKLIDQKIDRTIINVDAAMS